MIPNLVDLNNSPWKILPPGIHSASLQEVEEVFANTPHRRILFNGLITASIELASAGCPLLLLDGSYVTGKPKPSDYDVCWDPTNVDPTKLNPIFLDFTNKRKRQKDTFKGEFFPFMAYASPGKTFVDFFQTDRFTGQPKGILLIDIQSDPYAKPRVTK